MVKTASIGANLSRSTAKPRLRPMALAISVLLLGGAFSGQASAQAFPAVISLGSLTGSNGFGLDGTAPSDFSGYSVSAAGDINGDGIDDLIIGASRADPNGVNYSGSSYVVFGKSSPFAATLALSSLNGSNGFRIDGVVENDRSGTSVSAAGDINSDGFDDLIVGARAADLGGDRSGRSYVIFGKSTFTPSLVLSGLNGSNGFRIDGVAAADFAGRSVSRAGDINGDGFDDLAVGAYGVDLNGGYSGSCYVIFGKGTPFASTLALSSLDGSNGFRLDGATEYDRAGDSISAAGDVNGDGLDDLIVGAFLAGSNGLDGSGSSYVVFGKSTPFAATLALSSLNGSNGFRIDGVATYDNAGDSVSAAGDVNGDGFGDLIIGAPHADPNGAFSGSSYVVFGKGTPFAATLALSSLNGSNGFRLTGVTERDYSGTSVSGIGDFNGDGFDDVIVGAFGAKPNSIDYAGSSYVVFGKRTPFPATLALASLNGNNGFRLDGVADRDYAGISVSVAGDINDDGVADLIIGARGADANGILDSGSSYVMFGRSPALVISPTQLSFAATNVGQTTAAQTLTLSNTGSGNLVLGALALSGTNPADFAISADTCSGQTIVPTTHCTVDLSFSPTAGDARSARIDIASNAAGSPATVQLSGTGVRLPTTTTINSDAPDPSVVGQPYPVSVTVAAQTLSPTGTITITDGTASCGPATLAAGIPPNSTASCSLTSSTAGPKTLTASYTPANGAFSASSGTGSHQVDPAATTLSVTGPAQTRVNTPTEFTAALAVTAPGGGSPAGTITLSSGSSSCQITLPTATPSCNLSFDTLGARTISALFAPLDSSYLPSASSGAGNIQTLVYALADLAVAKTDTVSTFVTGDLLVYTITFSHLGGDTAVNLRLLDTVPAELANVAWTCQSSGGAVCPAGSGGGSIDALIPSYPAGALLTYTLSGNVVGDPLEISNAVMVEFPVNGTVVDNNPGNNSAIDLDRRDLIFAFGFESTPVTAGSGSYRLPSADLQRVLDGTARVVYALDDARGQAARVYGRVFNGQLQFALAQRTGDATLRLGPWRSFNAEPLLSWRAVDSARGWVVEIVALD